MIKTIIFYLLALSSVVAAIATVTTPRLLRAAVYLAVVLVTSAGFYLFLGFEFLAAIQILVYVGGIVVLFVFAVMLVSTAGFMENVPSLRRRIIGFISAALFFTVTTSLFWLTDFNLSVPTEPENEVNMLGLKLLDYGADGYVLPFEIISLLLLAAAVGGIVIARKIPRVISGERNVGVKP